MAKEVHCPNCNHLFEIEAPEDDALDLTADDEQELVVAPMDIQGQCVCVHKDHQSDIPQLNDGHGQCPNEGKPENGGVCTPCLFGCDS